MRARNQSWLVLLMVATVQAEPWLEPGSIRLRHDLTLLADAGIISGPISTWPMSWPDVARDVFSLEDDADFDESVAAALSRVRSEVRRATTKGLRPSARVSVANEPEEMRGFADTPREKGEVMFELGGQGQRFALNLRATVVSDPADERTVRPDGSYIGASIGNFMISVGYMDRWWGPGWEGSLIMSTNARPLPTLAIDRNYSEPFHTPLLRWLGPWRASLTMGQAESHDVDVEGVRLFGARLTFKPRAWLEIGLSRTAQWCGDDRPCGWGTFRDLIIGRDNRDESLSVSDEPGNQLAGYDFRIRSPWGRLPVALYAQAIGEDEAGGLPSKFLGLIGAETWFEVPRGNLRMRIEYSDTACAFTREQPQFNCAYRNSLYPQGYVYRGRTIGHAMDNDSRMLSIAAALVLDDGDLLDVVARRVDLNRDGHGRHTLAIARAKFNDVQLEYMRDFKFGRVILGLGLDDRGSDEGGSNARGFLTWRKNL